MSWYDEMHAAMAKYLRTQGYTVKEVLSFKDSWRSSGGCETCAFEYQVVSFDCLMQGGKRKTVEIETDLASLMRAIS